MSHIHDKYQKYIATSLFLIKLSKLLGKTFKILMSFRKANHLGLLSLLCYYYAIIADKQIFEKKANDCEKIIQEQCCQLASLTKELECAKGLAEDISLRLSEYESKTQELGYFENLKGRTLSKRCRVERS